MKIHKNSVNNISEVMRRMFPDKKNGIDFKVFDDGVNLYEIDASFDLPSVEEFMAISSEVDFQLEQLNANRLIDDLHSGMVQRVVSSKTKEEQDTWPLKLETAKSISSNLEVNEVGNAFLVGSGIVGDQDRATWANSVLTKASEYALSVGEAEKFRTNARAVLAAATTTDEIRAVVASITADAAF